MPSTKSGTGAEEAVSDLDGLRSAAEQAKAALSKAMGKKAPAPSKPKKVAQKPPDPEPEPEPEPEPDPEPEIALIKPDAKIQGFGEDVKYMRDNLMSALGVPAEYLVSEGDAPKKEKPAKKKRGRKKLDEPHTFGQGGVVIENFNPEKLNEKELAVLAAFNVAGPRETRKIPDLAATCFPQCTEPQANSWVRNSLRRLIRAKLIEKESRGMFKLTPSGRKLVSQ